MNSTHNSRRIAFFDRTNASQNTSDSLKRPLSEQQCEPAEKRPRIDKGKQTVERVQERIIEELQRYPTNATTFRSIQNSSRGFRRVHGSSTISSRPFLTSLVSSHKSDVFNLYSRDDPTASGLPFACAFTNSAKQGGSPLFAVATQSGTVEILNVGKRKDWDPEPQRISLAIHDNAILDLKWDPSDQYLATGSGDSTVRITSVETQKCRAVLSRHDNSVKTLSWDPIHADLLASGGRDGSICIWDVRTCLRNNDGAAKLAPVIVIPNSHHDLNKSGRTKISKQKTPRTVTSIVHLPNAPSQLISAGSFDSKLRRWDIRYPITGKAQEPVMLFETPNDPTLRTSQRSRGISTLALAKNSAAGLLWGVSADSHIHTYTETLTSDPNPQSSLAHPNMFVKSFYVRLSNSPCGSWLASGSSGGGLYVWDVASRSSVPRAAVELKVTGQEIGAIDWGFDSLAACCDDGTIRIWRPDLEIAASCRADPSEKAWDWAWATQDL